MSEDPPFRLPPVDPRGPVPASSLSPELLASLLVEGDDELAAWTLRHALEESPRATVFEELLQPAMALVGERWRTGQWSIAEEHLASQTVLRALDRIRPDPGPEGRIGPLAVLAGVAGEQHMLGLVCLAQVLVEQGWTVANLGADVPAEDLGRYVSRNDAALVALTASDPGRLDSLIGSIAAIRAARPGLPVLLGGRLALRPDLAATLGITWSGTSLVDAERTAAGILASPGSTPG